jgi:hypothetical protein
MMRTLDWDSVVGERGPGNLLRLFIQTFGIKSFFDDILIVHGDGDLRVAKYIREPVRETHEQTVLGGLNIGPRCSIKKRPRQRKKSQDRATLFSTQSTGSVNP